MLAALIGVNGVIEWNIGARHLVEHLFGVSIDNASARVRSQRLIQAIFGLGIESLTEKEVVGVLLAAPSLERIVEFGDSCENLVLR